MLARGAELTDVPRLPQLHDSSMQDIRKNNIPCLLSLVPVCYPLLVFLLPCFFSCVMRSIHLSIHLARGSSRNVDWTDTKHTKTILWNILFSVAIQVLTGAIYRLGISAMVCWSRGLLVCWSAGLLVCWSAGLVVCWSAGLLVC